MDAIDGERFLARLGRSLAILLCSMVGVAAFYLCTALFLAITLTPSLPGLHHLAALNVISIDWSKTWLGNSRISHSPQSPHHDKHGNDSTQGLVRPGVCLMVALVDGRSFL